MRSGKSKIISLAVFSATLAGMRVGRGGLHEASSLGSTRGAGLLLSWQLAFVSGVIVSSCWFTVEGTRTDLNN